MLTADQDLLDPAQRPVRIERQMPEAQQAALGWKPSVVSRLEAAEHNPSIDTLLELSRKLGLKMRIEVAPEPGVSVKVTKARAA